MGMRVGSVPGHQDGRAVEPKSVLKKTHGWLTLQHGLFSQASGDSSHPVLGMLGIQAEGLRIKVKARCPASRLKVHPTVALVWEQAGNRVCSEVEVKERWRLGLGRQGSEGGDRCK